MIRTFSHNADKVNGKLYVITAVFNPHRFKSRWFHYSHFENHVLESGAHLVSIEATFGARESVLKEEANENHTIIHVNTNQDFWLKENLINIAIAQLPSDWQYVAWVDADLKFVHPDWVNETLQQLQHYPIVQMYSQIVHLSPTNEFLGSSVSFMEGWKSGKPLTVQNRVHKDETFYKRKDFTKTSSYGENPAVYWLGSPGGAWAATRQAVNDLGGLLDFVILGSGDYFMAAALFGFAGDVIKGQNYNNEFVKMVLEYQENAVAKIQRNVGHMSGVILHGWHGKWKDRNYEDRWKILVKHDFNPKTDLKKDTTGLYQLTTTKWQLRDDLRAYFSMRNEDSIDI